jgi:hypothetical protein
MKVGTTSEKRRPQKFVPADDLDAGCRLNIAQVPVIWALRHSTMPLDLHYILIAMPHPLLRMLLFASLNKQDKLLEKLGLTRCISSP